MNFKPITDARIGRDRFIPKVGVGVHNVFQQSLTALTLKIKLVNGKMESSLSILDTVVMACRYCHSALCSIFDGDFKTG